MNKKNTVFIGFGDLAFRAAKQLTSPGVGISRTEKTVPFGFEFIKGQVLSPQVLRYLSENRFDNAVITLTPPARSDSGYKSGYIDPMVALLKVWGLNPPGRVIFISSTAVYGQTMGEWVDEDAECLPSHFSGRRLLEAERLLTASGLPHCILRLAGIYGPGREFLQRLVTAGEGGNNEFTNRIHADDAARFIAHLVSDGELLPQHAAIVNVCDSEPVKSCEVREWLAQKMGFSAGHLSPSVGSRGGSKRCSNLRMLATGFELQYPTYKDGYAPFFAGG